MTSSIINSLSVSQDAFKETQENYNHTSSEQKSEEEIIKNHARTVLDKISRTEQPPIIIRSDFVQFLRKHLRLTEIEILEALRYLEDRNKIVTLEDSGLIKFVPNRNLSAFEIRQRQLQLEYQNKNYNVFRSACAEQEAREIEAAAIVLSEEEQEEREREYQQRKKKLWKQQQQQKKKKEHGSLS